MERSDYVLAILSAGGEQASFSPVQVQKLFVLLAREIPQFVGGPYFDFVPYDFGPCDKEVYGTLDGLDLSGLAEKTSDDRYRRYSLTPEGLAVGGIYGYFSGANGVAGFGQTNLRYHACRLPPGQRCDHGTAAQCHQAISWSKS